MRAKKFRSNVAAVIIHPTENKVLMFRRITEKDKKSGFFVGLIMKETNGQADGKIVNQILNTKSKN